MPETKGYDSIDFAAKAALDLINKQKLAKRREYIALIYQDEETGKYFFTNPATRNREGTVKGDFEIPKNSLRAIIHNHPTGGSKHRDRLSEDDIETAKQFGVPSYIGVDKDLFKWNPVSGETRGKHGLVEKVNFTEELRKRDIQGQLSE